MSTTTQPTMIASSRQSFPRAPLFAAAALVLFAILVAGIGRITGAGTTIPLAQPIATRQLKFFDRPDGGIDVIDAGTGLRVDTITGQSGFLRGTVRGLASQRKRAGLDLSPPFKLTAWKDGRLTLDDPTNNRHIELEAFGATNEAVFADLLVARERAPREHAQ